MLGAGAWGWPREMLWGGRWEGASCLGMHVRIKDFKILKRKKEKKIKKRKSVKDIRLELYLRLNGPTKDIEHSFQQQQWTHSFQVGTDYSPAYNIC